MQNFIKKGPNTIQSRSYNFALNLVHFIQSLPQKDLAVAVIARQVLRSGTSIGANIIEAQAGSSRKDFTNFINHALKSANETLFWLSLLKDSTKVPLSVDELLTECTELAKILGASVRSLKQK